MADFAGYLALGAVVGFFAGLLGIGGGIIIVSTLAILFAARGVAPGYVMHLAIGTSLAAIIFGSFASFRAHDRRGAVEWPVVRAMAPGLLVGAVAARFVPEGFLKGWFVAFTLFVIAQMIFGGLRPRPARGLPGPRALGAMGIVIGVCSSLFGGGAAAIGVPFLTWANVSTHRAIGTVAALGFPVAIAGTAGYVVSGWNAPALPAGSAGFVFLPAFLGISISSMAFAPLGARIAHRLKGPTLRRLFAAFLLVMVAKLAFTP